MASFRYEALDAKGSTQNGLIEADHLKAARAMLRERGLVPLQVTPSMQASGQDKSEELQIKGRAFKGANLSLWTRQLAGLVSAGLPLERALSALMEEAETDNQRTVVSQLRSEVQGGASFAKALESPVATSASPPVFAKGVASEEAIKIRMVGALAIRTRIR